MTSHWMDDQIARGLAAPPPDVIGGIYGPGDDLPLTAPDGHRLINPDDVVDGKEYMIFAFAVWRRAIRRPGYLDRTDLKRWYSNQGAIFYCAHLKIKAVAEEVEKCLD